MTRSLRASGQYTGTLRLRTSSHGFIKYTDKEGETRTAFLHASDLKQKPITTLNGREGYKQIPSIKSEETGKYYVPKEFRTVEFDLIESDGRDMMKAVNVTLAGTDSYPQSSWMKEVVSGKRSASASA